ncbi:hypothetical protein OJAV_G00212870 [Oryzias javanicus]|uniref:Uncharacterized protein n=1 Tax=Oryzias javanicus TaxID=123683 RepID=A0A3S2PP42_ORYJA|nr:hypothetical protein OJAV_G00212870 [Oryzias javanicus]
MEGIWRKIAVTDSKSTPACQTWRSLDPEDESNSAGRGGVCSSERVLVVSKSVKVQNVSGLPSIRLHENKRSCFCERAGKVNVDRVVVLVFP